MGLEDTRLDVLQNIEFAIVSVYRERSDLVDYDVMRALDALIDVYRAGSRGHTPKTIHLPEPESLVFQRIKEMCEFRLGRHELAIQRQAPSGEAKTVDAILACVTDFSVSLSGEPTTQRNRMRPMKVFEI